MTIRLLIAAIALAGLLAGGLAYRLGGEPLPPLLDSAAPVETAGPAGGFLPAAVAPADLAQVANMIARPPFSASRRPSGAAPMAPAAAEAGPEQPLAARLLGVIRDGSERIAVLAPADASATVIVRRGGMIEGWEVEIIEDSRVVLRKGDLKAEIVLFEAR